MERKLILIAEPDRAIIRELGNAFHARGFDVRAARDGSQALEKSILVHPDLVLFDEACPLIEPWKFIQILRSNPRTEHIPVILLRAEPSETEPLGYREAVLKKPFNADEVLAQVTALFRRVATALEMREAGHEVRGSLSQIALNDLLQIFSLNRKTGLLELAPARDEVPDPDEVGQIFVQEGASVYAKLGRHEGEKALFRMLAFRQGSFAFIPERVPASVNIRRSTDMLLLEGARQFDELQELRTVLPDDTKRLVLVQPLGEHFEGLHPVTQEILGLLEFYSTVSGLVEHTRVPDYDACRAIQTLLDKGVLVAIEGSVDPHDDEPLLGHEVLYELKVRLGARMFSQSRVTRGKICLLWEEADSLRAFLASLQRLPGFDFEGHLDATLVHHFGLLGKLRLSENLVVDVMLLPQAPALRPLWRPLAVAASGLLLCCSGLDEQARHHLARVTGEFQRQRGLPSIEVVPPGSEAGPQTEPLNPADPAEVRAVMTRLLLHMAGQC